jgi:hypothetical protein
MEGMHLKEKALQHLHSSGNSQLFHLPMVGLTDLRGNITVLTELYQVTPGALTQKL